MKFVRDKFSGLLGKTLVTFSDYEHELTIIADQTGIRFDCPKTAAVTISTEKDLQDLAKAVSDAWVDHVKLAPKLTTTLSGH